LSDFGLSQLLCSDIAVSLPLWTAPEVIMGSQPTPASDVYSFAIVLWELLTRHVPFDDDVQTPIRLLRMITNSNLRPTLPEGCPPQLIRVRIQMSVIESHVIFNYFYLFS
jgi:serine/threonine protein kinase